MGGGKDVWTTTKALGQQQRLVNCGKDLWTVAKSLWTAAKTCGQWQRCVNCSCKRTLLCCRSRLRWTNSRRCNLLSVSRERKSSEASLGKLWVCLAATESSRKDAEFESALSRGLQTPRTWNWDVKVVCVYGLKIEENVCCFAILLVSVWEWRWQLAVQICLSDQTWRAEYTTCTFYFLWLLLYIHRSARKVNKVVFREEKNGKNNNAPLYVLTDRLLRVCLRSPLRPFSISKTSNLVCFGRSVFEECCFLLWAIVMLPGSHSAVFWTRQRKHDTFHHWCLLPLEKSSPKRLVLQTARQCHYANYWIALNTVHFHQPWQGKLLRWSCFPCNVQVETNAETDFVVLLVYFFGFPFCSYCS